MGTPIPILSDGGGGEYPHPSWQGRGYPILPDQGQYPNLADWGVPLGTPQLGLDGGTPPPPLVRRQSSRASTCYAAGGMPVASTQEDFLIRYLCLSRCRAIWTILVSMILMRARRNQPFSWSVNDKMIKDWEKLCTTSVSGIEFYQLCLRLVNWLKDFFCADRVWSMTILWSHIFIYRYK